MKAYVNSTRLRPIAAGVAAAIGTMTFHPAVAQVTGQPTSPGETRQTEPLAEWTRQEKWVWSKVCVGEIADFNTESGYGDELDPNEPQGWPESRVLTPEFLETILLHEPFRSAQTRLGVRIRGAWFKDEIDLEGAEIERKLWLDRSRLDKGGSLDDARIRLLSLRGSVVGGPLRMQRAETGALFMGGAKFQEVDLRRAKIGGKLSMIGSTFAKTLNMDSATVEGHLSMRGGAEFQEVDLRSIKIAGQLSMIGSTFDGKLIMNSATVDGELLMREKAKFQEVDLIAAKIGGELNMSGSRFAGTLNMNSATVEGDLFMGDGANFQQEVNLIAAKIGRAIDMKGSTFGKRLNMTGATVVEDLLMQDGGKFQEVILSWAKIGRQIDMRGSTFDWKLSMVHAETGALFMSGATFKEVDLRGAKIVDQLDMTGATFAWTLSMVRAETGALYMGEGAKFKEVDLRGAKIAGQLDMHDSTFAGTLDMRSATVGGNLLLHGADLTEAPLLGGWLSVGEQLDLRAEKVSTINLRGATVVDELRLLDSAWKPGSILDLQYAKVGRLAARIGTSSPVSTMLAGFIYDALGSTTSQTDKSKPVEDAADFVEAKLRDEVVHSPQAHEQFAAVLRQMGFPDRARRTLYEGKNHELLEELRGWHLPQAGWLFLLWAMIGYGYRVWYGLVWIAVLVGVGWRIARKSGRTLPDTGEPLGFWYSADRLLPIMVLRKSHYEVDLPPRSRVYFYFHMVMGYVLSMFLLAGLSGLVG